MNLIVIRGDEVMAPALARLGGARAAHLLSVVGVGVGDELRAGLYRGPRGTARVARIADGELWLELSLTEAADPRPPVDLVLALPRPKVLRRALADITAFGVGRIDLTNAWRVERSYFQSPVLRKEVIAQQVWLGAEQGASTWVPEVQLHHRLMSLLGGLPAVGADARSRLIAEPEAPPIETVELGTSGALLAIGPEGGWIERELESFRAQGFVPVSMGPGILRTEAAISALLAQLALLMRLRSA